MTHMPLRQGVSMRAAWYAVIVLTVATLLAVVDRGVLVLQADTIRKSLGLSDFQLGFLQGTGVAITIALVAYPLGWLADRFDRRVVLSCSVMFWCAAVVASGMAQNFEQMLLFSALVGAGEAALVPVANAMIPDLFPESKRQAANSTFALSSTLASGVGLGVTGLIIGSMTDIRHLLPAPIAQWETWRISFLVVALPAPLMVLLIMAIRLPQRRSGRPALRPAERAPAPTSGRAQPLLPYFRAQWRTIGPFYAGVILSVFGFNALGSWLAVIYQRVFHQTPEQLGAALGTIGIGTTLTGFVLSIYGMRYLTPRVGAHLSVRVLWVSVLAAGGSLSLMWFATTAGQMFVLQGCYILLLTGATMIYPTVLQNLTPRGLRARAVAVLAAIQGTGSAIASPLVGFVSDHLSGDPRGLIHASVMVAVPALLTGAFLLFLSERGYERTKAIAAQDDLLPSA